MLNTLCWIIGFSFVAAFIVGFITYNVGTLSAPTEAKTNTNS